MAFPPVSAAPPIRTPFFPQQGALLPDAIRNLIWIFSWPWIAWFQYVGSQVNKVSLNAPLTSTSPGKQGTIASDGTFIYVCVSQNSWKRAALTSF